MNIWMKIGLTCLSLIPCNDRGCVCESIYICICVFKERLKKNKITLAFESIGGKLNYAFMTML